MVHDVGKLALLAVTLVGMFGLRLVGQIDDAGFYSVTGAVVGYLTGNGVLAARRRPPSPAIGPRDDLEAES